LNETDDVHYHLMEGKLISGMWRNLKIDKKTFAKSDYSACDEIVTTPTVLLMRFEAWNIYHQSGEWINTFVSLLVMVILGFFLCLVFIFFLHKRQQANSGKLE
jgi:hypothetical protein